MDRDAPAGSAADASTAPPRTFITHTDAGKVAYRLAELEISSPAGPYNTELEEAQEALQDVALRLKSAQQVHDTRTAALDERERILRLRQVELDRRRQELDAYIARSKDKQHRNTRLMQKRFGDITAVVSEISRLTDCISGATTLLSTLVERNQTCMAYSVFVEEVFSSIVSEKEDGALRAVQTTGAQRHEALKHHYVCQDYVCNIFARLTEEEKSSVDRERALHEAYDGLMEDVKARNTEHRVATANLEQQISDLNAELDALTVRRDTLNQDDKLLNLKLHTKTQELSGVYSSVKNLLGRVAEVLEERHSFLTARASIGDLLGGVPPKLQAQVAQYHKEAKGLVSMDECFGRILGEQLLNRLRDIYKLGLALEDATELVQIAKSSD